MLASGRDAVWFGMEYFLGASSEALECDGEVPGSENVILGKIKAAVGCFFVGDDRECWAGGLGGEFWA